MSTLYISPSSGQLVVGDSLQFTAYNGTLPYVWSTTDTSVAIIDTNGLLIAHHSGSVQVVVHDSLGASGITDAIEIYDAQVTIPEVYGKQGGTVDVPIKLEKLANGVPIFSLQLQLLYDSSIIKYVSVVSTATLTEGWSYSQSNSGNHLTLAAASATSFQSTGTLLFVRFQVGPNVSYGSHAYLNFQQMLFNEGTPSALTLDGGVIVTTPPSAPQLYSPPLVLPGQ